MDKNNEVLDINDGYIMDNDNVIRSGKTEMKQIDADVDEYDHAEVFISSRSYTYGD